jgi:hypothetical protein
VRVKSGRTSLRKGGGKRTKPGIAERETLWIVLAAFSMRMTEVIRMSRGMANVLRRSVRQLGKLELAVKHQTSVLDELPDLVRDEIGSWPRKRSRKERSRKS